MAPKKRKASKALINATKQAATSPAAAPAAASTHAESSKSAEMSEVAEETDAWWALAQQDTELISFYKLKKKTEDVAKDTLFEYIAIEAGSRLAFLRQHLESIRRSDDIGWASFLNVTRLTNRVEGVHLYLRLRRDFGDFENTFPDMNLYTRRRLADMVQEKFPYREKYGQKHQEAAFLAFSKSEAPGREATSSSLDLLEQVEELAKLYDDALTGDPFLSPYTALIGPSGMGKSFAVKHLAETRNRYIVYASLGEKFTVPLPAKPLSKMIRSIPSLHTAIHFFKNFINVAFGLVEAAKTVGVRPGLLFNLQSEKGYVLFQENIAQLVGISLGEERDNLTKDEAAKALVPLLRDTIKKHGLENDLANANEGSADTSPLILCLDEARFLLTRNSDDPRDDTPLLFRGFRKAIKASEKKVFGLLLDTSSKVGNFLPPVVDDPSLKIMPDKGDLLPPIYSLPTWDVMARTSSQVQSWLQKALPHRKGAGGSQDAQVMHGPDGSIEFQQFLYSLGRPLWASIMQAHLELERNSREPDTAESIAVQEAIDLAREKTAGNNTKERWIALLSYRLQFHVHDQRLVNTLTSRWLRYPVRVSKDRSQILSIQPGEPILAAVAAWQMSFIRKPAKDLGSVQNVDQMVDAFFNYYNDGAINVGDIGEMIASFLLLWAADVAAQNASVHGALPRTVLATAIPMVDLLGALFGSKPPAYWTVNALGENDAEDTCVFLTHIMRLCTDSDVGHLTPEQLEMGFLTGEGWLLEKGHAGADLLLPVWHKKSKRMAALLVQVKNIKPRSLHSATFPPAVVTEAWRALESARKTLEGVLGDVHVYGLYLDLGAAESHATMPVEWLPRKDSDFPQLSLAVTHGCSADVYEVLAGHDGSTSRLQAMLARGREPYADDTRAIADMVLTRDGRTL